MSIKKLVALAGLGRDLDYWFRGDWILILSHLVPSYNKSIKTTERSRHRQGSRDILGHSSSTMTGDYTHSTHESQLAAMELVASYESRILHKISTKKRINELVAAN